MRKKHDAQKYCSLCKSIKQLNCFDLDKNTKDGFQYGCKECRKKNRLKWRDYILAQQKQRALRISKRPKPIAGKKQCNGCSLKKNINEFWKSNRTIDGRFYICIVCEKKKRAENKENIRQRNKIRSKERKLVDPSYKLRVLLSSAISDALKKNNGSKNGKTITKYLSYTIDELKRHLERQFEPWMSWRNHGKYMATWDDNDCSTWTWQIDHIMPVSCFCYSSIEDDSFKKCWRLENLRPYSAKQNLLDGVTRIRHV
jgi:hypothetical protein